MPLIKFITHDGGEYEANAAPGDSIMSAAVASGIDAILAECGGSCSCATCHCYIDEKWLDKIPAAEDVEIAMLDYVLEPKTNSRLSCQVELSEAHDGLVVHLPESQV